MGTELRDGTIVPSKLIAGGGLMGTNALVKNNTALRTGQVIKIYYPEDPGNLSKKYHEYDVLVAHGDAKVGTNVSIYRNCKVSNIFASDTESLVFTLQVGAPVQGSDTLYTGGSIVNLLCIDGKPDSGQSLIIGGLQSPQFAFKTYSKADGNFYDFNFNGININVNNDGEYSITFNSVLNPDGIPTNQAAQGTKLVFDQQGRVTISDNESQSFGLDRVAKTATWTDGDDSIVIDKGNKAITMTSTGTLAANSDNAMTLASKDSLDVSSEADMNIASSGNQSISAEGNSNLKAANWNVNIQGNATIQVGGTFQVQAGAAAEIQAATVSLADGSVQAAGVGISMVIGTGNEGAPVISQILTGSATVMIGT
jgi:hypothetical protein